jgi:hypothetical protein
MVPVLPFLRFGMVYPFLIVVDPELAIENLQQKQDRPTFI